MHARATVRRAGSRYLHTVFDYHGATVATRRSERRYAYAICRRVRLADGATVAVVRWSSTPSCSGTHFALAVEDA